MLYLRLTGIAAAYCLRTVQTRLIVLGRVIAAWRRMASASRQAQGEVEALRNQHRRYVWRWYLAIALDRRPSGTTTHAQTGKSSTRAPCRPLPGAHRSRFTELKRRTTLATPRDSAPWPRRIEVVFRHPTVLFHRSNLCVEPPALPGLCLAGLCSRVRRAAAPEHQTVEPARFVEEYRHAVSAFQQAYRDIQFECVVTRRTKKTGAAGSSKNSTDEMVTLRVKYAVQ